MHSYSSSATAMFVCIWRECVCVSVCVCVCLSVWSAVVCLSVHEQRRSVCVHCPTASAENKKTPARRFGAGCQKAGEKSVEGGSEGEGEKKSRQPRDISILTPRIPQAAGRRLQNGSSSPCHRVGSALSKCLWLENTDWKVSPLSPSHRPHCFSRSSSCLSPPVFCPSFIAHRKGSSFSPVKLSLNAAFAQTEGGKKHSLPSLPSPSLPLTLSLELCQSSLSRWGICQSVRSPFLTKTWCLSPGSCR